MGGYAPSRQVVAIGVGVQGEGGAPAGEAAPNEEAIQETDPDPD